MGSFRRQRDGTIRHIPAFLSGPCGFGLASFGFDWVRFAHVTNEPTLLERRSQV
jgi:hypothetical protein